MQQEPFEVPESSPALQRSVDAFLAEKKREAYTAQCRLRQRRALYLCLLTVLLSAGLIAGPQRLYSAGKRAVYYMIDRFDTHSAIHIGGAEKLPEDFVAVQIIPEHLPEGYWIKSNHVHSIGSMLILKNQEGDEIMLDQAVSAGIGMAFDTEDSDQETLDYMGYEICFYTKGSRHTAFWADEKYTFLLIADNLEREEVLALVESIIKQQLVLNKKQ